MSTALPSLLIFISLIASVLLGMALRRVLPEHHLSSDTHDTVKLSMGLVATTAALVLGLLIASAKDNYDKEAAGVTEIAAKVIFLDRLLANFGPAAKDTRQLVKKMVQRVGDQMWPENSSAAAQLDPTAARAETILIAIQNLTPTSDLQTTVKSQALSTLFDLGQARWQEFEQARSTISKPLLLILTFWLVVLFSSFGMFAPGNGTALAALFTAAAAVAIAVFLMIELNSPFHGLLQISREPFDAALTHLAQ